MRESAVMAAAQHADVFITRLVQIKLVCKLLTMIHVQLVQNKIINNKTIRNFEENKAK